MQQPSLSSCLWEVLNTWFVDNDTAVYKDWAVHLGVVCWKDERFTNVFANEQMLSECLNVSPNERLPLDAALDPCKLSPSSMHTISPTVQPIILLLQELLSGRAADSAVDADSWRHSLPPSRRHRKSVPLQTSDPDSHVSQQPQPQRTALSNEQCGHLLCCCAACFWSSSCSDCCSKPTSSAAKWILSPVHFGAPWRS